MALGSQLTSSTSPPRSRATVPSTRDAHAGSEHEELKVKQPFLSNALADEYIGLEEVGDGVWNIVYYETLLGRIDERTGRITGTDKV